MPRTITRRTDDPPVIDTPGPTRTPGDVVGDMRDRLTVLLNATQLIRLACPGDDPRVLSGLRMIEQQVVSLGRLGDEILRGDESVS
jgi:hypothetical protein